MGHGFPNLFLPLVVGPARLKNRIFSTGHMTVMLENGFPSDAMVAYHKTRAEGGAGLIILEAARAHVSGDSGRPAIRAYDDNCIPGYQRIAEACHPFGCKVFAQLSHPGREMPQAADGTYAVAFAPSSIPNERFHVMPREMTQSLIAEIINGFEAAAGRIRQTPGAGHGPVFAQVARKTVDTGVPTFAPALINAIFDASGKRHRSLPISGSA